MLKLLSASGPPGTMMCIAGSRSALSMDIRSHSRLLTWKSCPSALTMDRRPTTAKAANGHRRTCFRALRTVVIDTDLQGAAPLYAFQGKTRDHLCIPNLGEC